MKQNDVHLLIHHHHIAFIVEDGVIWLFSVIGRWNVPERVSPWVKPPFAEHIGPAEGPRRGQGITEGGRRRGDGGESNFRMDLNIQKFTFDGLEHMFYNNWVKELRMGILAVFY